jgi:hypothetical protein
MDVLHPLLYVSGLRKELGFPVIVHVTSKEIVVDKL